jgi:hypothetical protein
MVSIRALVSACHSWNSRSASRRAAWGGELRLMVGTVEAAVSLPHIGGETLPGLVGSVAKLAKSAHPQYAFVYALVDLRVPKFLSRCN